MKEAARFFLYGLTGVAVLWGLLILPDLYRWAQKKYQEWL